jgi:hypothetical protein
LIVGQFQFDQIYNPASPYREVFAEYAFSGLSMEAGFSIIQQAISQYLVARVYVDPSEEQSAFTDAWYAFQRQHGLYGIQLTPAPYANNFIFGLSLIQDALKSDTLDIPKTFQVFEELKQIAKPDLATAPEIKYPAINALRFVIGSFRSQPVSSAAGYRPDRSGRSGDWMR